MIKIRLLKMLNSSRRQIALQIFWQWLSLIAQIILIFAFASIFDQILHNEGKTISFMPALCTIGVAIIIRVGCSLAYDHASFFAASEIKQSLRFAMFEKLARLGTGYREQIPSVQITQMLTEGIEQLETYVGRYLSQFFYALLAPITLFIILVQINAPTSIVLLCAVPLIPIVIMVVMKLVTSVLSTYFKSYYQLGDTFLEKLHGMTTLKVYQADQTAEDEIVAESEQFRRVTMKVLSTQLFSTIIMDLVAYGGAAVGIVVALSQYHQAQITFQETIILVLLATEYFLPMRQLGAYFHMGMNGMKASDKIFEFLDLTEPTDGDQNLADQEFTISSQDLTFTYPHAHQPSLTNIALTIQPHQLVAFVGPSGAGKSTLAALLSGQVRQYAGSLKFGPTELSDLSQDSLCDRITIVSHHAFVFKGSFRDNLILAKPDATDQELMQALKQVNLWDFCQSKAGLTTLIETDAANLSGGQKQRLAIARALLTDAQVFIFDEATSNIDQESEAIIMRLIKQVAKTKTVILISHRLANVTDCDQIFYLDQGKIIESGDHQTLLAQNGAYTNLFNHQAELESFTSAKEELS